MAELESKLQDKLRKILALKEQLRQEMKSPEYQQVKKLEREAYLKTLNIQRRKYKALYNSLEGCGKTTAQVRYDKPQEAWLIA